MRRTLTHLAHGAILAGGLLANAFAFASGLQISPVSLSLAATQNADGLWLSNTGGDVVRAQVRVFRWTQDKGADQLAPSRDLLISPPMLDVAVGGKQMIRAIRAGAPPSGEGAVEAAYRVVIDELPIEKGKQGVQFVMRYSVPIFVQPVAAAAPPQLRWSLHRDATGVALEVVNTGGTHAQLAALNFVDAGGRSTELSAGLLGYVLPGATMRWPLKQPAAAFTAGGAVEAMVNGDKVRQDIALADR